ncbi:MAG TPA: hypothetical protein VJR48_00810, partial [Ktedonobacterales bacterium]|nr:hypothetical protein [Ktedonobacterales bacterium]
NHLWIGHYVYISPMASGDTANLSPDWELNQNGTLIAGLPGGTWSTLPDGYTGSSAPMPSNPPPPPPPVKPPVIAPKKAALPPPRPTPTPKATSTATALPTATSLPTALPTATARPQAVCAPLNCALTAVQSDLGLLMVSLLLLLLTVMWFPAAVFVARVRTVRRQWSKEAMLQTLVGSGLAASEAPTLADLLAEGDMSDDTPTAPLTAPPKNGYEVSSGTPDGADTSGDAPEQAANQGADNEAATASEAHAETDAAPPD